MVATGIVGVVIEVKKVEGSVVVVVKDDIVVSEAAIVVLVDVGVMMVVTNKGVSPVDEDTFRFAEKQVGCDPTPCEQDHPTFHRVS